MNSFINLFIRGLLTPFRAMKLIRERPKLMGLSIAPAVIAVLLMVVFISFLLAGAWTLAHSTFLSFMANFSGVAFVVFSLIFISAALFFASSLFNLMVSLAASPLNDWLAEKTEAELGIADPPKWNMGRGIRIFWIDLRKTLISVLAGVVLGIGMLIPVANALFFIGLAFLNTFTFITYPQSRREQGLLDSMKWIRQHLALSLGFGITTTLLMSIPFLGILLLPVSVVGGTLLYVDSTTP